MKVRELDVAGAWEITPQLHPDARGLFFEWVTDSGFTAFAGHRLDVRQANCSVSSAGVLRGLHFAQLPPSQAKYVTCVQGSVFDVVVDIRVGSPTFGRWDAVLLDGRDRRSVYISEGSGARFPCAARRFNGDVSVLGRIRSRARTHHPRDRPGAGNRLADGRRAGPAACPSATPRRPPWPKSRPLDCCPAGRKPRPSLRSCATFKR